MLFGLAQEEYLYAGMLAVIALSFIWFMVTVTGWNRWFVAFLIALLEVAMTVMVASVVLSQKGVILAIISACISSFFACVLVGRGTKVPVPPSK